jgi:oligopeptide/dipeptide ABC transporter ATP-binding protein
MLFISHNLEVVYYLCDRIAVMFEGRIVEQGTAKRLYDAPLHPYTQVLLAAIPSIHERNDSAGDLGDKRGVQGETASATACPYAPRCPRQTAICWERVPELRNRAVAGGPPHLVRCHLAGFDNGAFGDTTPIGSR